MIAVWKTGKPPETPVDAFTVSHRKSHCFAGQIVASGLPRLSEMCDYSTDTPVVTCRLYATAGSTYACIWLAGGHSASAVARGYGYHRASAAVAFAIEKLGIALSEPIEGAGDTATHDAILAVARLLGETLPTLSIAHA